MKNMFTVIWFLLAAFVGITSWLTIDVDNVDVGRYYSIISETYRGRCEAVLPAIENFTVKRNS